MIDQDLIDRCEAFIDFPSDDCDLISLANDMARNMVDLIDNYKNLTESNAELHKEIAKLRAQIRESELSKLLISEDDWPE